MYLIATRAGLFKLTDEENLEKLPYNFNVSDVIINNERFYVCSSEYGVIIDDKKILEEGCWRLWKYNNTIYAFIEGPKIYEIKEDNSANLVLDLTQEAEKMGWEFPYGPPHITDITLFKGLVVATVEEGNLLVGDSIKNLKPINFFADMHNLLSKEDNLLVATASGIFTTNDLNKFEKRIGGYAHGIEELGKFLVAHVMSDEPLIISRDKGCSWEKVNLRLPRPTFGETAIAKKNDRRIIYSTTAIYEVDIIEKRARELIKEIPTTNRVIKI